MEQLSTKDEKCRLIDRLKHRKYRESYIRASINVNLPSQIRALRLAIPMTQQEFAIEADMKQPRISAMEKPGAIKFNIETLVRLAAAFRVGLIVKFVPVSEMLDWENRFSQDEFNVVTFDRDPGLTSTVSNVNTGFYYSVPATPNWLFVHHPQTMRALPERDLNITTASMPADAGSTTTVQGFQLLSQ